MSCFFGLGIPMSWYMCFHGLVFVIIVKIKESRIIISIMLLKNISIVQVYATSMTTCKGSQKKSSTILYR